MADHGEDSSRVPSNDEVEAARGRWEELTGAHGQDDDRAVAAAEHLALLHYARRETAAALPLMRLVTRARPAALGSRRLLSTLLRRSGNYEEALVEHGQVVAATVAESGAESRAALASKYNHAMLLREAGDVDSATRLFTEVAQQATRALGPDDVVTQAARDQAG
ncbi:hypothetical protein ACQEVB_34375 [Pseudonocardia sp. CA-107938]|uniref:hypothetical protein n=1 Tax=Pseudonocardia sp. CA-107938 TaxID=3240021 RepID=UPI003D92C912